MRYFYRPHSWLITKVTVISGSFNRDGTFGLGYTPDRGACYRCGEDIRDSTIRCPIWWAWVWKLRRRLEDWMSIPVPRW